MQSRKSTRWLVVAVVLPPIVCALAIWCGWRVASDLARRADHGEPTRAEIENVARITLPPGATDVHARLEGFQDRIIQVRFQMPSAERAGFLHGTRCTGLGPSAPPANPPGPDTPWWQPERAVRSQGCEGDGTFYHQAIFVDETDGARDVVYVVTFEH